jgi:hypothetical protein
VAWQALPLPYLRQHLLLLLRLQACLVAATAAGAVLGVLLLLQEGSVLASELAAAVLGVVEGSSLPRLAFVVAAASVLVLPGSQAAAGEAEPLEAFVRHLRAAKLLDVALLHRLGP